MFAYCAFLSTNLCIVNLWFCVFAFCNCLLFKCMKNSTGAMWLSFRENITFAAHKTPHIMARFLQYYLCFRHDLVSNDWKNRQQLFAEHLATPSIKYQEMVSEPDHSDPDDEDAWQYRMKEHKYQFYYLSISHNIIVMHFADDIILKREHNFKIEDIKHEPSSFVVFDNREGQRRVLIQKRRGVMSPGRISKLISSELSDRLFANNWIKLEIRPHYYPKELFAANKMLLAQNRKIKAVRFSTCVVEPEDFKENFDKLKNEEKAYFDDCLLPDILKINEAVQKDKCGLSMAVMPEGKESRIPVNLDSPLLKNYITWSAVNKLPVVLETSDGATFSCLVDADSKNQDSVVSVDFEAAALEKLFTRYDKVNEKDLTDEDVLKIETKLLALLDNSKHVLDEDEEEAVDK